MERESSRQKVGESKEAASKGPVNTTSMREGYRTAAHDIVAGRCCTFDHSSPLLLLDVEFPLITRPTGGQCWPELTCRCRKTSQGGRQPAIDEDGVRERKRLRKSQDRVADSQTSHEPLPDLKTCRRPRGLYIRLPHMHPPFSVAFFRPCIRRTSSNPSEACVCTISLLTILLRP